MSTCYRLQPNLPWQTFLDGLRDAGLRERPTAETTETNRFIQLAEAEPDHEGGLWFDTGDGTATYCTRYGIQPDAETILDRVEQHYGAEAISEHGPGFFEDEEGDEDPDDQGSATQIGKSRCPDNDSIREDFLTWSGGFPPESNAQIAVFVETAIPADADPDFVRQVLTAWMDKPD
jgi:hypothetical protein